jgi:hypothetical protein
VIHLTSNRGHGKIITGPEACVGPPVIILAERPRPRQSSITLSSVRRNIRISSYRFDKDTFGLSPLNCPSTQDGSRSEEARGHCREIMARNFDRHIRRLRRCALRVCLSIRFIMHHTEYKSLTRQIDMIWVQSVASSRCHTGKTSSPPYIGTALVT